MKIQIEANLRTQKDGEPCSHRGCLSHITHPCEGCGRIAGKKVKEQECEVVKEWKKNEKVDVGWEEFLMASTGYSD